MIFPVVNHTFKSDKLFAQKIFLAEENFWAKLRSSKWCQNWAENIFFHQLHFVNDLTEYRSCPALSVLAESVILYKVAQSQEARTPIFHSLRKPRKLFLSKKDQFSKKFYFSFFLFLNII